MKNHIKFVFGVSLMTLALAGCGKKEKTEETPKSSQEATQPVVTERPQVVCDDVATKNRVVGLVQEELLKASVDALGNPKNLTALEQHLKSRLAQTQIDVQNIRYDNGECQGELHISLNAQDVAAANKAFAAARVASLDERAVESGVSLLGGHRLVSNFVYQVDGEAVAINTSNPAILVASKGLAQATIATHRQDQATARNDSGSSYRAPNITPPPATTVRPAPIPRPSEPQVQARTPIPSPESAVLRPEDVPSRETRPETAPSNEPPITTQERSQIQSQVQSQPEPAPKPRQEPKAEPKAEPKPQPAPVQESNDEITIIESNETY